MRREFAHACLGRLDRRDPSQGVWATATRNICWSASGRSTDSGWAPQQVEQHCCIRTLCDPQRLDAPLVALLLEQYLAVLEEIVLDVDATHDPLYMEEKARDFHSRSHRNRCPPR